MLRAMWVVTMAVMSTGCIAELSCPAPTETDYRCELEPPGSLGCAGDPGTAFGMEVDPPPGVAPVGCEVVLPYCTPSYPTTAASCTCVEGRTVDGNPEAPYWLCPL